MTKALEPALIKYRVTYLGRRPRSSRVVEMTATVIAKTEVEARRRFYGNHSVRAEILTVEAPKKEA